MKLNIDKKYRLRFVLLMLTCALGYNKSIAQQEAMFSNYMLNMMPINPAYAGSREALNATLLYKKQWMGIDGAPLSQSLSLHGLMKNEKVGLGLALCNDKNSVFGNLSAQLAYAYIINVGNGKLAFGLQGGIIQHNAQLSNLQFAEKDENGSYGNISKIYPSFGTGIYYHSPTLYFGVSAPRISPSPSKIKALPLPQKHFYATVGYNIEFGESFSVRPSIMARLAENTSFQTDINLLFTYNSLIGLGCSYRTDESIVAMAQLHLGNKLKIAYAYDYGVGRISKYFDGSHEILLIFETSIIKDKVVSPRFF